MKCYVAAPHAMLAQRPRWPVLGCTNQLPSLCSTPCRVVSTDRHNWQAHSQRLWASHCAVRDHFLKFVLLAHGHHKKDGLQAVQPHRKRTACTPCTLKHSLVPHQLHASCPPGARCRPAAHHPQRGAPLNGRSHFPRGAHAHTRVAPEEAHQNAPAALT